MSGQVSELSDKLGWRVKHLYPDWQLSVNEHPGRAPLCLLRVYFSDWQASSPRLLFSQHEVILHACRSRTLWGKWDETTLSSCLLRNEHTNAKTSIETRMAPFKELTQPLRQTSAVVVKRANKPSCEHCHVSIHGAPAAVFAYWSCSDSFL